MAVFITCGKNCAKKISSRSTPSVKSTKHLPLSIPLPYTPPMRSSFSKSSADVVFLIENASLSANHPPNFPKTLLHVPEKIPGQPISTRVRLPWRRTHFVTIFRYFRPSRGIWKRFIFLLTKDCRIRVPLL